MVHKPGATSEWTELCWRAIIRTVVLWLNCAYLLCEEAKWALVTS
jgi:hypothetical protein